MTDWQLVGLMQSEDGTLTTQDGDPQMILEDVGSRVVRTISYTAEFDGEAREMCLYYTTKVGEDYSADRRVFPQSLGSGQYVYTLPRTSLAALRLDPCSPEENKAVTLTMSDITLNAADTLPAVWQYFVPTWYQAFCLVLYPALAAAAVSMVGAVAAEKKAKIIFGSGGCFTQVEHPPFHLFCAFGIFFDCFCTNWLFFRFLLYYNDKALENVHFYRAFAPLVIIGEVMSDKEKILIADDSAMNRAILTEMLGDGYELLEAENGRQAVAICSPRRTSTCFCSIL